MNLQQKITIPAWVIVSFFILSCLSVNYGFIYFLLIFLGINQFAVENTRDGKTFGLPLSWPNWLRKSMIVIFWFFTVLFIIGAYIENHPDFKVWLFSKLP